MNDGVWPTAGSKPTEAKPDEPRLQSVVEDYLARLQAGEDPDASDYILDNPSLAAKLENRLQAANFLHSASKQTASAAASPSSLVRLPTELGRYRIEGLLGSGASADVFRAHDPKFQRSVALKVLRRPAPIGSDALERFERDARIAAQLRHPNIVPLHDAGEEAGCRFIDMEMIEGESLEARLCREQRPWDFREAAELVQKLAAALHYAHRAGIVHRDVKPSNILIDQRGEPQLTDFGLARLGNDQTLTVHGQIIGTPIYMPPEQADGRGHQADHRSDVYSLGIILFRLLTGRLPFDQTESMATLLGRIIAESPPHPRSINPHVPRNLEWICLKALEKNPDDRFATADAFADELRRWLNNEPLSFRPPSRFELAWRWTRRHRAIARIIAVAAALLILTGGALSWAVWKQREQRHAAELREAAQRQQAVSARELERVQTEKRVELEAWSLLVQARQRLSVPTLGRRSETQALLREAAIRRAGLTAADATERINLEIRSLYVASLGVPDLEIEDCGNKLLPGVYYAGWRTAIHPDGKSMMIGTPDGPVRWVRGQPFVVPHELDADKPRPRLGYSPDGTYLAFAPGNGGLQIWNERATEIISRPDSEAGPPILDFGFTRDTLWACRADGVVISWSMPGFMIAVEQKLETGAITAAKFNRDATWLAIGQADGQVRLSRLDMGEAKSQREWDTGRFSVDALAWSPDDSLLAIGTKNGIVQLWSRDGPLRHEFYTADPGVSVIQFHRDGRWLLAGGRSGGMQMWHVETGELQLSGPYAPWSFAADGESFAGGNVQKVAFNKIEATKIVQRLPGHRSFVEKAAWSPNSRYLATLDSRFDLRVWDVTRGLPVRTFAVSPGSYTAASAGIALSNDGAHIAYCGGGKKSTLEIFDVCSGASIADRQLPEGFTQLVHDGSKFILVREEWVEKETRTVACSFTADNLALNWQEVRPGQMGEVAFHSSALTPDGRYYLWAGPRRPADRMRVEVYEESTGRLVRQIPFLNSKELQNWGGRISPDGKLVWVQNDRCQNWLEYALANDDPPSPTIAPTVSSPNRKWYTAPGIIEASAGRPPLQSLRMGPNQPPWLHLLDGRFGEMDSNCFSPDSRYVIWFNPNHAITVLDLPALLRKVQEFERSLQSR